MTKWVTARQVVPAAWLWPAPAGVEARPLHAGSGLLRLCPNSFRVYRDEPHVLELRLVHLDDVLHAGRPDAAHGAGVPLVELFTGEVVAHDCPTVVVDETHLEPWKPDLYP